MKTQRPLSDDQMEQFRTFGFLAFPGLLADCIDRIIEEFEAIWAPTRRASRPRARRHRQVRDSPIPRQERVPQLPPGRPADTRHRVQHLRRGLQLHQRGWQPLRGRYTVALDGYGTRPVLSIKMAFYLDPTTKDTGALRVIRAATAWASRSQMPWSAICATEGLASTPVRSRPACSRPRPATSSCSTTASSTPPSAGLREGACTP